MGQADGFCGSNITPLPYCGEVTAEGLTIQFEYANGVLRFETGEPKWITKPSGEPLPYIDRVDEMPVNRRPFHPDFVRCFKKMDFWPIRALTDITGVTIHHTLSHSPLNTARYCTAVKGYPSVQYHYWVSAEDGAPVYKLAQPGWQLWHDHTGSRPTTLSVGMAGRLHLHKPPTEQLEACVRLVRWLMHEFDFDVNQVQGHKDRAARSGIHTICPGWDAADWRDDFYRALESTA